VIRTAALLLLAAAPPPDSAHPAFELVSLRSDIAGDQVVGAHRQGLICGPGGKLRWREAEPDAGKNARRVAAALKAAGLDVFVPDPDVTEGEDGRTPLRIVATVVAAKMEACTAWRGIKVTSAEDSVRAHGRLAVVWRVYDRGSRALRLKVTACQDFRVEHDAPTIGRATEAAIAASAGELSPKLARAAGSPSALPPEMLGCEPAELAKIAKQD
jgi:hypothetical protein